jgi:beta-mannosidase
MMSTHPLRPRWELAGPWKLKADPDPVGAGSPRPYAESRLDVGAGSPRPYTDPEYDDGDWRQVPPATHLQPWLYPDNPYWGEHVRKVNDSAWWYRTRFFVPHQVETRLAGARHLRLAFEGVDYRAEVWCNGQRLGEHAGAFAPFSFDVTGLVGRAASSVEPNTLAVKVTSPWDPPRRRALSYVDEVYRGLVKGLYAHGDGLIPPDVNPIGIWRPAWIEAHADVTLDRVSYVAVEDEYDRSARLVLRLHVHNRRYKPLVGVLHVHLAGETFEAIRADEHSSIEVPPGRHVVEHVVRIPDPQWWWPWDLGHPDLYRLRCTLMDGDGGTLDRHEQVLGIRQVRLLRSKDAMHYQINKVPFFVRGTSYMGGLYLSQLTPEQIEADLDRVQECGLNMIRLHVHVAPPEVYAACDRRGILVWQDFELNWLHDRSPEFEEQAVGLLREMVARLDTHPSIITWCCHNEPAALPFLDVNLAEHPTRRLFREITALDPSRPAFLCSGKREEDWLHSGDTHDYVGGSHGGHYLDVYGRQSRLVTEFGCDAPLNEATLDEVPLLARRLRYLRERIPDIQAYQAALFKYQIEWYRITRLAPCGGYVQFMFIDLYPQVGYGVIDAARRPKAAFDAVKSASQPVHVLMEHTGTAPVALWVVNDTIKPLIGCLVEWGLEDERGEIVTRGSAQVDVPAQRAHRVMLLGWRVREERAYSVVLRLVHDGRTVDENRYDDPFHPLPRPRAYPWSFDPQFGMRCYGGPHAQSSLRVFNTWYGRLARAIFPVHDWAERWLAQGPDPRLSAWLKRLFGDRTVPTRRA